MRLSLVLTLLVAFSAHAEQPRFPDSVAGKLSAQWLEAFNSGRYETLRAFYAATSKPGAVETDTLYAYSIYLDTRGFDFRELTEKSETEVQFRATEKVSGQWCLIRLQYAAETPHAQTNFGYAYIYPPDLATKRGRLSEKEIASRTDRLMTQLAAADVFSGAVLVAKDDHVVFEKAYGLASKAYGVPNKITTKFNIGSITKVFTAVAIAELAGEGKLSFSDPIGKYLTDYPSRDAAAKVTIHQLLTHTAGIARQPRQSEQVQAMRGRLRTVQSWLPLFADKPLEFEPGARYRYSNEGYIILGAIIELVSGQSYYDYVKQHIFEPAKMRDTDFYELDFDTPNMATGYTRFDAATRGEMESRKNNVLLNFVKGAPSGGAYSTVEDLLRFSRALLANKLLPLELTKLVVSGSAVIEDARKQAYGFAEDSVNGVRLIEHSGAVPGGEARLELYPDRGYTVISLANYDYQVVHRRLRDWIAQQ